MSDLFNNDPAPASAPQSNEQNVPAPAPAYDHLLTGLKNAQGEQKYSSMEHAFDGFAAAQQHIAKLETEANELRAKANEAKAIEDILAAVQSQGQPAPAAPVVSTPEVDLDARIADVMAAQASQQVAEANGAKVVAKVQEAFGEKAGELYYAKAEALGMNKQTIDSLARTSPEAVFTMLGIKEVKVTPSLIPSGINTESFQHTEQTLTPKGMFGTNAEKKAEWDFIKAETARQLEL